MFQRIFNGMETFLGYRDKRKELETYQYKPSSEKEREEKKAMCT